MFKWLSDAHNDSTSQIIPRDTYPDSGCTREPSPVPKTIRDIFTDYLDNDEPERNTDWWRCK